LQISKFKKHQPPSSGAAAGLSTALVTSSIVNSIRMAAAEDSFCKKKNTTLLDSIAHDKVVKILNKNIYPLP
jgi:hypothetical protein